jgi:phenylacetate-CoA ligase
MKSHLPEQLYLSSPVWLQNVLVSIYGNIERKRRYGGEHSVFLKHLRGNKFLTLQENKALQKKLLTATLDNATRNVPAYQHLRSGQPDLSLFPLLDRQQVANNTEQFVSSEFDVNNLIALYTGGSSASPLKVYISKTTRQKTYSFWQLFYDNMDFNIGDRKASFVGRKLQEPDNNLPPFWRYNIADRQLLFSSYHMEEANLPLYVEKLNAFKPKVIEGYPFSIYRIAEHILNNSLTLSFTPTGISTSSENFSERHRKVIESAFNCRVFDQYGSAESVVFASECEHGTMHIEPEYGILEVLTESGEITPTGKGELIATTLLNDAMPLIRYRIGDLGVITEESCLCGRDTPVLKELHGKVDAVIINEGRQVPTAAIAIAFEYLEGIKNAQIIQNEPGAVIVKLVKKSEFNPKSEDFMIWELRKMLGESLKIEVEYVNDIPPEPNGKYKMVVQNVYQ